MQTIAFHSYKGGVGRTMALANLGYVLAKRGRRVTILDLDIDAPGLHMKFELGSFSKGYSGFLGYLYKFYSKAREQETAKGNSPPIRPGRDELTLEYKLRELKKIVRPPLRADGTLLSPTLGEDGTPRLNRDGTSRSNLLIIPAGGRNLENYWRLLSGSAWTYKLFSPRESELQERVLNDQRDVIARLHEGGTEYLLIDCKSAGACSRYILSNWANIVVAMFPANEEGVYGVVQSTTMIKTQRRSDVVVIPVMCRVPEVLPGIDQDPTVEEFRGRLSRGFAEEGVPDSSGSLAVLHEFRELETKERILLASDEDGTKPAPVVLSHDYAELFHKIFQQDPNNDFGPLTDFKERLGLASQVQLFEQVFKWFHNGELFNSRDKQRNVALRARTIRALMMALGAEQEGLPVGFRQVTQEAFYQTGLEIGGDFGDARAVHAAPPGLEALREAIVKWCDFDSGCGFGDMRYLPPTTGEEHTIVWADNFLAPEDEEEPKGDGSGLPPHIRRFAEGYIQGVLEKLMGVEYNSLTVTWAKKEPSGFKFVIPIRPTSS